MKIYTRAGDDGETSLFDGTRVPKSDARVDAYGEVDELNAMLGLARANGPDVTVAVEIEHLQRDLHAVCAQLADPSHRLSPRHARATLGAGRVAELEATIDRYDAELPPLTRFVLSGGSAAGAALHVARTVCRRAERRIVALGHEAVDPSIVTYMNRLSDLLFAMARLVNHRAGMPESEW